jgi:CYTH domain-containing protein
MIELELTYLAKSIPSNLKNSPSKKIVDIYIENGTNHADLRIRKNGNKFEITRKTPVEDGDASRQTETTIPINEAEFESLSNVISRKVEKTRYFLEHNSRTAEFDVFEGDLAGLVVVDFEFESETEKDAFAMLDFCLADVTQEDFIAGGMIAGKNYEDIKEHLTRFGYKKLELGS